MIGSWPDPFNLGPNTDLDTKEKWVAHWLNIHRLLKRQHVNEMTEGRVVDTDPGEVNKRRELEEKWDEQYGEPI